jgi:uncharacterized protein with GYD domain
LIFIMLFKDKKTPTKQNTARGTKMLGELEKKGIKILGFYWTLGRFDDVVIFEAPTEKDAMKLAFDVKEDVTTETLVAIPREEGLKLL